MSKNLTYSGTSIPDPLSVSNLLDELKSSLSLTQEQENSLAIIYVPGGGMVRKVGTLETSETVENEELLILNLPDTILDSQVDTVVSGHLG